MALEGLDGGDDLEGLGNLPQLRSSSVKPHISALRSAGHHKEAEIGEKDAGNARGDGLADLRKAAK